MLLTCRPSKMGSDSQRRAAVPSWDDAYVRYRPLLFNALSKLAARGFTAAPDDAVDLIHDFFLEAWANLASTYDPSRAKFETYLYASFLQFARPRIVQRHRWRDALVTPDELAELEGREVEVEPIESSVADLTAIREATTKLPAFDRDILYAYLSDSSFSERELARRFSVTRYELRLRLGDALGRVATDLGELSRMSRVERAVAVALWREGRSVKEAADILGIAPAEIQIVRKRLFRMLSSAVKGTKKIAALLDSPEVFQKGTNADRKHKSSRIAQIANVVTNGKGKSMLYSSISQDDQSRVERILTSAIKSPMKSQDLEAIRQNQDLILRFLDSPQSDAFFARHRKVFASEHLAQLYSALGSDEITDPEDAATIDALFNASEQDEEQIGKAFSQVLIRNLPIDMKRFHQGILHGAPLVDLNHREALMAEKSVQFGGKVAAELTQYGLTPVTIVLATQGIANVARRFCQQHSIEKNQSFILDRGEPERASLDSVLGRAIAVKEVMWTCEIHEGTASRLYDWLLRVAGGYAPAIFDGFDVHWKADELYATRTDESATDLFVRWCHLPPPAVAA